jgi:hypothetical protein
MQPQLRPKWIAVYLIWLAEKQFALRFQCRALKIKVSPILAQQIKRAQAPPNKPSDIHLNLTDRSKMSL